MVAAAIHDQAGRWLMQKRPHTKDHAGLWEFPGGKVEPGETPLNALVRELSEELALTVAPRALSPAGFAQSPPSARGKPIVILLYTALHHGGGIVSLEGAEVGWFTKEQISMLAKPPLDVDLAQQLFAPGKR